MGISLCSVSQWAKNTVCREETGADTEREAERKSERT